MNETLQTIFTRRSIRSFTDQPISKEHLDLLVQAALCAPSGMGLQTWQFTVVSSREKIDRLAQVIGKEDDACAMENIFLAAHSLGIGSVWINQLQGICDESAVREVLRELQIPDSHVVYGLAALGYAAGPVKEKERTGKVVVIS